MVINIIKMVDLLNIEDDEEIESLLEILNERKESIEMMEPEYDGEIYDKWDERYSDIDEICDICESLLDEEIEWRENIYEDLVGRINDHQFEYGGLLRFK